MNRYMERHAHDGWMLSDLSSVSENLHNNLGKKYLVFGISQMGKI